jgi:carbon storage regulator CsrA
MLVMSLRVDDSIMIGDGSTLLSVTLSTIDDAQVVLQVAITELKGRVLTDLPPWTGRNGDELRPNADVSITVVEIMENRARLGFNCPPSWFVHRKEVYDALLRQDRGEGGRGGMTV